MGKKRAYSWEFLAATIASTLVSLSLAAPASATHAGQYQNSHADVAVSGGQATALNECINEARDGTISQTNNCIQIATSGNIVILENVTINVYEGGSSKRALFSKKQARVELSGGIAEAISACVNDARDGVITQTNACDQSSSAGNIIDLSGIAVTVG